MGKSISNITFVSTMHKELGKCNADELCMILEDEKPNVIFLEALENTYSNYERGIFSSFGVYHQKLEIEAIQKYSNYDSVKYVPVLDSGLSDSFNNLYERISKFNQYQQILEEFNLLVKTKGFPFLNSKSCMEHHLRLRILESNLLNDKKLEEAVNEEIDDYEYSMIKNISSYSSINRFDNAIFMCGSAHRQGIIEKIRHFDRSQKANINWIVYGD